MRLQRVRITETVMRLVHLEEFDGLALIVKSESGVVFTNQAGGLQCLLVYLRGPTVIRSATTDANV